MPSFTDVRQKNSYEYESDYCNPIEFGTLTAANWVRDQYFDCIRPEDDARKKTVVVSIYTPTYCMDEIIRVQRESFEEIEGDTYGQESLTSLERSKIDFSEVSYFHAAAVKAIASHYGVFNWIDYYDPTLTTHEHINIYEHEAAEGVTMREMPTELMI